MDFAQVMVVKIVLLLSKMYKSLYLSNVMFIEISTLELEVRSTLENIFKIS